MNINTLFTLAASFAAFAAANPIVIPVIVVVALVVIAKLVRPADDSAVSTATSWDRNGRPQNGSGRVSTRR